MFRFKKGKYGAVKTNGLSSKLESAVYDLLKLKEKAGELKDIKLQQSVELSRAKIMYKADFSYVNKETEVTVWVEAKGFQTDTWRLKKKLWKFYGPGKLEIYTGDYRRPKLTEEIVPE